MGKDAVISLKIGIADPDVCGVSSWSSLFYKESVYEFSVYKGLIYSGSNMSVHMLLNLLNELGKRL